MVVLPSTGASRYHNCCIDGGTSHELEWAVTTGMNALREQELLACSGNRAAISRRASPWPNCCTHHAITSPAHTHTRTRTRTPTRTHTHTPTTAFLKFSSFLYVDTKLRRVDLLFKLMCMLVYFFCGYCGYYCISWYFLNRTRFVKPKWTVTINEYICKDAGRS